MWLFMPPQHRKYNSTRHSWRHALPHLRGLDFSVTQRRLGSLICVNTVSIFIVYMNASIHAHTNTYKNIYACLHAYSSTRRPGSKGALTGGSKAGIFSSPLPLYFTIEEWRLWRSTVKRGVLFTIIKNWMWDEFRLYFYKCPEGRQQVKREKISQHSWHFFTEL